MKFLLILPFTCLLISPTMSLESEPEPELVTTHPDKDVPQIRYSPAPFSGGEHVGLKTKWHNCSVELPPLQVGDLIEFDRKIVAEQVIRAAIEGATHAVLPTHLLSKELRVKISEILREDVGYQHWAIYSGEKDGVPHVINYQNNPGDDINTAFNDTPNGVHEKILSFFQVIEEPLSIAIKSSRCRVNNRMDFMRVDKIANDTPFKPSVALDRARRALKIRGYNLHNSNCESFVRWARNGARKSMQVIAHFNRVAGVPSIVRKLVWGVYDDKCETMAEDAVRYGSILDDKTDELTQSNPIRPTFPYPPILPSYRPENTTIDPYFCSAQ